MIKTRPNRGDPVGTYREGKVYLSENFQRYLDEIDSSSNQAVENIGLSTAISASASSGETFSIQQITQHILNVEIQLTSQLAQIARLEQKIHDIEDAMYAN